ncbi:hypothetical protein FE257_012013 [Aspergillus nanangensis]|uniref:SNARE complex subunit n=1 Tax=Aspergillus nanangensis TaxID=2582783 RepID=A0AAD4GS67_ASPNN|nr:hypothetical protein FE257_012013 [Aspergillus nanangensis]
MAPLEIAIPSTSISPTSPPYTVYNISLRDPLRSFTIAKRYSDFVSFHSTLINQTNDAPPAALPSKSWFSNTVTNASLRENRRAALETYLRAINNAEDSRWRNSPAWRAFLNLPTTSTRLRTAITEPGHAAGTHPPITDPILWLDSYRDMKSHLHDVRAHLMRRDQETTPQKQHESSARAKSSLVRAGSLISALEEGLKNPGEAGRQSSRTNSSNSSSLGDGELRRRKDQVINARKEKDGLEDLLNTMAAKSRVDTAVASNRDKEVLVGGGASGKKSSIRPGRVLGKETERTRELDNQGVLQLQRQMMDDQDQSVQHLMKGVHRLKDVGIQMNEELEYQNALVKLTDEDVQRVQQKVGIGNKRVDKIS